MLESRSNQRFLEDLYRTHYAMVYQLAAHKLYRYLRVTADAADLTQEVFILTARRIEDLRQHPNPSGWLCKATHFVVMNHIRTKAQRKEQLFETLDQHGTASDDFAAADVLLSLENMLSKEDYALIHAYYIEKQSRDEICRQYGLSPSALRVRMHRLRKHLLQYFIFLVTLSIRQYI